MLDRIISIILYVFTLSTLFSVSGTATLTTADNLENITRLYGAERCATSIEISKAAFDQSDNIILVSGDNYADALAGGPLAYALDAPILLIRGNTLSDTVINELERLGALNIFILGGEVAISEDISNQLTDMGYNTERLAGATRFDTAVAIANKLVSIAGKPDEIFFACSHNYPDALAISNIAAIKGCPVLYISSDGKLSESTAEFILSYGTAKATILGGTQAISADAEVNIAENGLTDVSRIAGDTRFDTCLEINKAYEDILTGTTVCIATGLNYPDALAGSVLAAKQSAPILLIGNTITAQQEQYLSNRSISEIYVFGGISAVSDGVIEKLESKINKLAGTSVYINGDSISYGMGYDGGYGRLLEEKYGAVITNVSSNGATLASGTTNSNGSQRHHLCESVTESFTGADIVIISGGFNDYGLNVPIGTLTDSDLSFDTATLCGALEQIFTHIQNTDGDAEVYFLLTHKINSTYEQANKNGDTMTDFADAIRTVCTKYDVKIIDVWKESGFLTRYSQMKQFTINADGIHPNEQGYRLFYLPVIERALGL